MPLVAPQIRIPGTTQIASAIAPTVDRVAAREAHTRHGRELRQQGKGAHLQPVAGGVASDVGNAQAVNALAEAAKPGFIMRVVQRLDHVLSIPNYAGMGMFLALPFIALNGITNLFRTKVLNKGASETVFRSIANTLNRPQLLMFGGQETVKGVERTIEALTVKDTPHTISGAMRWVAGKTNSEGMRTAAVSLRETETNVATSVGKQIRSLAENAGNAFEGSVFARWADNIAARLHLRAAAKLAKAQVPVSMAVNEIPVAAGAMQALHGVAGSATVGGTSFVGAVRDLSSHLPGQAGKQAVSAALGHAGLDKAVNSTRLAIGAEGKSIANSIRNLPASLGKVSIGHAAWGATVVTGTAVQAGYMMKGMHGELKVARQLCADMTGQPLSKITTAKVLFSSDPIMQQVRKQLFLKYGPQSLIMAAGTAFQVAMLRGRMGTKGMMAGMGAQMLGGQLAGQLATHSIAQSYATLTAMQAQGQSSPEAVCALIEAAHKPTRAVGGLENPAVVTLVQGYVQNKTPAVEILKDVASGKYTDAKLALDEQAKAQKAAAAAAAKAKAKPVLGKATAGVIAERQATAQAATQLGGR